MIVIPMLTFGLILRYLQMFKSEDTDRSEIKQSLIPLESIKSDHNLLQDRHLAAKKFEDPEIAAHTVMIMGIPSKLSTERAEQEITGLMKEILRNETLPEDQLVAVHSVTNLDKCKELLK